MSDAPPSPAPAPAPAGRHAPTASWAARLRRTWPYFRSSLPGVWAALLAAALAAATEPLIPALLKPLLDQGFQGGQFPLWAVPVSLVGLFALRGTTSFVAQYALAWSINRAVLELRMALFKRLQNAHPQLYAQHNASALTNTVVYEVQMGANYLGGTVLNVVKDGLTVLALLGYLLWLNWALTLAVLLMAPPVALVIRTVSKRLRRLSVAGQDATDRLAYVVEENVLAWRVVRLHGAQAEQGQRFEQQSQALRRLVLKSVAAGASSSPITQVLTAIAVSGVITMALWQQGGSTVGGFVAFITAMLLLVTPLKHLSDATAPLERGLAAVERGLDLMDHSPVERGGHHRPAQGRAVGHLVFDRVDLQYRPDLPPALQGVGFEVQPGQTCALVGLSGSGKTSLVQMLPRFLDPTGGQVRLDGVDLRDWDLNALRDQLAYVSQEVVLFNDTLLANVALGDLNTPEAERRQRAQQALQDAHLWGLVEGLPLGLDTVVGHNGNQLSGGQRQRLAIARALYKNAPLLILDEATSALDSESEKAVQAALERLMQGRTTIVIAHRLSTIEHAHHLVVLDEGRVAESGTPQALLHSGGVYARLHALQFKTP